MEQPLLPGAKIFFQFQEQTYIGEIIDCNWDAPSQQWIYRIKVPLLQTERLTTEKSVKFFW